MIDIDIDIDPDIRRARALPGYYYGDLDIFERHKERLFAASFQLVAHERELSTEGSATPKTLLPGLLDEPLVLTRDRRGVVRCLSNVCTHRGNLLVLCPGAYEGLRCGYHGRRFDLAGRCLSMPGLSGVDGFPSSSDDLETLPLESLGPFLFASLTRSATSLRSLAREVVRRVGFVPLAALERDECASRTYEVAASWMLYVDNYLEGFHIPFVHPELARTLSFRDYRTELLEDGVLQVGVASEGESAFDLPADHPDEGARIAAYYFWLFPNTMLNFYPWGLSINVVLPIAPDRTRVVFESWVLDASKRAVGAGAELDLVERQDEAVVEQVQRGVRSRLYDRGRYSPTEERGVHHFHRLLTTRG